MARNIKLRAKNAISKLKQQRAGLITTAATKKTASDDKDKLLHKTITPKKTANKKEKIRQKHKNLLLKFSLLKKQRKEENARKNREKTAVIGDLKPLKDALPSLDELFKLSKEKKGDLKTGVQAFDDQPQKLTTKQKLKSKKTKFMTKINSFEALLKDPDFRKNPREAISYHIKYTHGLIDE